MPGIILFPKSTVPKSFLAMRDDFQVVPDKFLVTRNNFHVVFDKFLTNRNDFRMLLYIFLSTEKDNKKVDNTVILFYIFHQEHIYDKKIYSNREKE